jgi:hypothetical protein
VGKSFAFIISKEDQNYHSERDHITKVMSFFKLSKIFANHKKQGNRLDDVHGLINPHDAS